MRNLKKMLLAELAAADAAAELNEAETAAYAMAHPESAFVGTAAVPRPPKPAAAPKPASPAPKQMSKAQFNQSVHSHFTGGRTLTDAHRKAISEGLRRWHAAHGRGKYTGQERRHAIKHLTRRFTALADHHANMHSVYKQRAKQSRKNGMTEKHQFHQARAKNALRKHNLYTNLASVGKPSAL